MAKCMNCMNDATGRSSYCSSRCKVAYNRNKHKAKSVTDVTVTARSVTVTGSVCWCCGAEIDKRTVCCQDCAWSGKAKAERVGSYLPLLDGTTTASVQLPACVPEPIRDRYIMGEPEYTQTIDRLLAHTLDELEAMNVWIPTWRHYAGQAPSFS